MPSLQFKGKVFVQNHHLVVPYHELTPVKAKGLSKTASLHDNLIIEGDNLAALKALLPAYHGKVKCIYIDPPYNTGNEKWVYNDNVNSPMMQDWLGKVEVAWPGKIDIDDFLDCGGTIAHDEDAIGKLHGFFNVVRDEENGFLFALPNAHEIGPHFFVGKRL
jgi:DNA modification methylase